MNNQTGWPPDDIWSYTRFDNNSLCKLMNQHLLANNFILSASDVAVYFTALNLSYEQANQFVSFLNNIQKFLPIASIKKEILDAIGVKAISDENAFYAELEQLIVDQKINEALLNIQDVEDEHVCFNLGLLLEKHKKYSEAIELYQDIPQTNPHYKEANKRAGDILFLYELSHPNMTKNEQVNHLDAKIRFLLRAGSEGNQPLLDRLFSERCLYESLTPLISNVRVDEDTLMELLHHTASLAEQISVLKKKLELFEKQEPKNSGTFFQPPSHLTTNDEKTDASINKKIS